MYYIINLWDLSCPCLLLYSWIYALFVPVRYFYHFIGRKTSGSYRELEARKKRLNQLEKLYMDMTLQKELQVSMFKLALLLPNDWVMHGNFGNKRLHWMARKRVKSANCMKMRLSVQLPNRYTSGGQNERGERCLLWLFGLCQLVCVLLLSWVLLKTSGTDDTVNEAKILMLYHESSNVTPCISNF